MNLFWLLAAGLVFAVSAVIFWKVLRQPSNTTKHLYEVTIATISFLIAGQVFTTLLAVKFFM